MFASSRCPTVVVGFTLLFIWDEKTRALFPARAQFQLRTKPIQRSLTIRPHPAGELRRYKLDIVGVLE